jgi:formate hydrogenlyase transcriptional activator
MPSGLMESEMFGHERGAYTGAFAQTVGKFQLADGGTLFLDEVGDLPLELQPKLLRALQEREFERLGGTRTIRVNLRVISATNADMVRMIRERGFRADLYYRLNVFPISIPPLRERREDIPALVWHFVRKFARQMNREIDVIPDSVMDAIQHQPWPGNVRELQNFVERAVIQSPNSVFRPPIHELAAIAETASRSVARTLEEVERDHIIETVRASNGVISGKNGAAIRLGMKRTTLLSKMLRLGIKRTYITGTNLANDANCSQPV